MRTALVGLTALVIATAHTSEAQAVHRPAVADSSARQIMAHVGRASGAVWLRDVLRQADGNIPSAKLDEIADSLAARAIAGRDGRVDSASFQLGTESTSSIALAGMPTTARGTPYPGALERLIRIHQHARSNSIRIQALAVMPSMPDRTRAIGYLADLAASRDATAVDAVQLLITDANGDSWGGIRPSLAGREQSAQALRNLSSHPIASWRVRQLLEGWIAAQKSGGAR